ncbi:MAG: electron transfer flavoprotein subunit beta/FixA family protein [Ruminococcaceae bacterium]|nr:electron transfer flavoprotein subunit beta/FixA family protein [Oscillospiraceae bacterium]
MTIITCVKQVPGTNKVAIDPVTGTLKRDGVASKLNPYDLFALETAFVLAEQTNGKVKALSMGPPQAKGVLEESLWMGADEGLLLSDRAFGGADVAATSYCLSLGVEKLGEYDIIICGKQTTDGDTAQVGPELAERLGIEHAANVLSVDKVDENSITVTLDLDGVQQTQKMSLPCLITMEKDTNTPRLPSYLRRKAVCPEQIKICSLKDFPNADVSMLGINGSPTRVERIFSPEVREGQPLLTGGAKELSQKLYDILCQEKFV